MSLIAWNQAFCVKIKKFDDQHKELVRFINQLHDAMKVGKGREVLGEIFQSLANYTITHFRDEELVMRLHKYEGYEEHKKEHGILTAKVNEMLESYSNGNNIISLNVMSFMRNWLIFHILECDKNYGSFLNSMGVV